MTDYENSAGVALPTRSITRGSAAVDFADNSVDAVTEVQFKAVVDLLAKPYYARTTDGTFLAASTGVTTTALSPTLTAQAGGGSKFQVHDWVKVLGAGADHGFKPPAMPIPTVVANGAPAGTTIQYVVVAMSEKYGYTMASAPVTVTAPDVMGSRTAKTYQADLRMTSSSSYTYSSGTIANVPVVIDAIIGVVGNTVLIDDRPTLAENGVYAVSNLRGAYCDLVRATDWTNPRTGLKGGAVQGDIVWVNRGKAYGNKFYRLTSAVTTVGTDPISFSDLPHVDVLVYYFVVAAASQAAVGGTFTTTSGGTFTGATAWIDGYQVNNADDILVQGESSQAHNGIYTASAVSGSGMTSTCTLIRKSSFNSVATILAGTFIYVKSGSTIGPFVANATNGTLYQLTSSQIGTLNTDPITFANTDVAWFVFLTRNGTGPGAFGYLGALNAAAFWATTSAPSVPLWRDFARDPLSTSSYAPNDAPAVARNDWLDTQVVTVVGDTITVADNAVTSVPSNGAHMMLDNSRAIINAQADFSASNSDDGGMMLAPPTGFLPCYAQFRINKRIRFLNRGCQIKFGPGFGISIEGAAQSSTGTRGDDSDLSFGKILCEENTTLPQGRRYIYSGPDPLNRPPMQGAVIHVLTTCVLHEPDVAGGHAWGIVFDGRDVANNANCNNSCAYSPHVGGNYRAGGYVINGANANTIKVINGRCENVGADGYINDSFLGSDLDNCHAEACGSDLGGYTRYNVTGEQRASYNEVAGGNVRVDGGIVDNSLVGVQQLDPNSVGQYITGQKRSGATFGAMQGVNTLDVAAANDDRTWFFWQTSPTYAGKKLYHALDSGIEDGAQTAWYRISGNVGFKWMGSNATGPGIIRFPNGFELTSTAESGPARWRGTSHCPTLGVSNRMWYGTGVYFHELNQNGILGWKVSKEFLIATTTLTNGAGAAVGDGLITGPNPNDPAYVVIECYDFVSGGTGFGHPVTGVLGATPSPPGAGNTVICGTCLLQQVTQNGESDINSCSAMQAVANQSEPFGTILPNTGSPASPTLLTIALNGSTRGPRYVPTLTATRAVKLDSGSGTTALRPGQQRSFLRAPGTTGDFDYRFYDVTGATEIARLRPGAWGRIRTQFIGADGANTPANALNLPYAIEQPSNEIIRRPTLLASGDDESLQAWPSNTEGTGTSLSSMVTPGIGTTA